MRTGCRTSHGRRDAWTAASARPVRTTKPGTTFSTTIPTGHRIETNDCGSMHIFWLWAGAAIAASFGPSLRARHYLPLSPLTLATGRKHMDVATYGLFCV